MIAVYIVFEGPKALQIFELQKYLYIYMFNIYQYNFEVSSESSAKKNLIFKCKQIFYLKMVSLAFFFIRFQCWTHRQSEVCSCSLLISKN